MLPGKVLESLDSEGLHLVQRRVAQPVPDGLHGSTIQFGEVNVEDRSDHVELYSEGPIAHQKVKGRFVKQAGPLPEIPECGQRSRSESVVQRSEEHTSEL